MDFKNILDLLNQKMKHANEVNNNVYQQTLDRVKMMNPDVQGPRLSLNDSTPDEKEYYESLANGVAGSLAPVGRAARMAEPTAKELAAKLALDSAEASGANITGLQRAAQPLSREIDFTQRNADQLRQARLNALKRYNSR